MSIVFIKQILLLTKDKRKVKEEEKGHRCPFTQAGKGRERDGVIILPKT